MRFHVLKRRNLQNYKRKRGIEALSRGYTKYKDILDQSHVSSGPTLVDVLDKLL